MFNIHDNTTVTAYVLLPVTGGLVTRGGCVATPTILYTFHHTVQMYQSFNSTSLYQFNTNIINDLNSMLEDLIINKNVQLQAYKETAIQLTCYNTMKHGLTWFAEFTCTWTISLHVISNQSIFSSRAISFLLVELAVVNSIHASIYNVKHIFH